MSPIHRLVFRACGAALALLAGCLPLHAATVSVSDMLPGQWAQTVLTHQGDVAVGFSVTPSASNPNDTFWLTSVSKPVSSGPNTSSDTVANLYTVAAWAPANQGAVDRLDFLIDARGVFSSFASTVTGFVRPLIEQGGVFFAVPGSDLQVSTGITFNTLSWQLEDSADWQAQNGSGLPDFSAAGAPIHFGYRFGLGTSCTGANGCNGVTTFTAIDNFRVDVITAAPAAGQLPEPTGAALVLLALAAAGFSRRR